MKRFLSFFLFAFPLLAQNPQAPAGTPLFRANAKYVNGMAPGYAPSAGAGLVLNIGPGTVGCGGTTMTTYAGGTLTLTNSTTNYVYLDTASSCAPAFNTSGFTAATIPIATVITSGGAITVGGILDSRTPFSVANAVKMNGVAYPASPSTHTSPVITASNVATYKTLPDCPDTGGNHFNYTQSGDTYSCGTSTAPQPYELVWDYAGKPAGTTTYLWKTFAFAVTFPANFTTSTGKVLTNATGTTVFTVKKNGSTVGTISVATSGTITFATSGGTSVSVVSGDYFTIVTPAQDATLADVSFDLYGTR